MTKDLRSFLDQLRKSTPDELLFVKKEVDPSWEISAFLRRLQAEDRFPTVYYEKVKGSTLPVVSNLFASRRRLAIALETSQDKLTEEYARRITDPVKSKSVRSGPVKDIIQTGREANLKELPIVTHCEKDAAPYITVGLMITKDPETGAYNAGIFRLMLRDQNKLLVHIGPEMHAARHFRIAEEKGEDLEVAIAIGHHPLLAIGSQQWVPSGTDKLDLIGGLLKESLELCKCETVNLEVPAYAEIILEGRMKAKQRSPDGPFGEFAWYYGAKDEESKVIEIAAITRRSDAIYHDLFNAHLDHNYALLIGKEGSLLGRMRQIIPEVRSVTLPESGACRFVAYIKMKKHIEGMGKNAAMLALSCEPRLKIAVVVDEDVDITKDREVIWAIATRTNPEKAFFFVPEAYVGTLDPTGHTLRNRFEKGGVDGKVGIDATKPLGVDFPERADVAKEKWEHLNIQEYITKSA